jgi:hypothetical protein
MKKLRLLFAALFLLGTMAVGYLAAPAEASGNCRFCNPIKNTCVFVEQGYTGCTWIGGTCTETGDLCGF